MSNAGVCQDTILGLSINDLPDDFANCNIAICNQDINHSSKCDLAFDLWQQLENAREIEFRPWDTVDYRKKWLFGFTFGKTQPTGPFEKVFC